MRDNDKSKWVHESMFDSLVWFFGSKQKVNTTGAAKEVPLDMSNTDLKEDLQTIYPEETLYIE